MSQDDDRAEILRLHNEWWEANRDIDTERMRQVFPEGHDSYLMYNLSGHPYYGLDEKVALWEALEPVLSIPDLSSDIDLRVEVRGDMAWVSCEKILRLEPAEGVDLGPSISLEPARTRSTEVFIRDDGTGQPVWKMWHFHGSFAAPDDDPRVPMGDSYESRGQA